MDNMLSSVPKKSISIIIIINIHKIPIEQHKLAKIILNLTITRVGVISNKLIMHLLFNILQIGESLQILLQLSLNQNLKINLKIVCNQAKFQDRILNF